MHTTETIRIRYFMDLLMEKSWPVMLVGNAGTGKSVLMGDKLDSLSTDDYLVQAVPFNFYTTSAMLQGEAEAEPGCSLPGLDTPDPTPSAPAPAYHSPRSSPAASTSHPPPTMVSVPIVGVPGPTGSSQPVPGGPRMMGCKVPAPCLGSVGPTPISFPPPVAGVQPACPWHPPGLPFGPPPLGLARHCRGYPVPFSRGSRKAAGEEIRAELWTARHQEADLLHRRHEHA